ncbi:MAG: hypothetical protein EPN82_14605 [Bacteroidetes bacterium]|nr:MAG: hypothetical protein EPN82_14605 [Bacteroidota bacterium]
MLNLKKNIFNRKNLNYLLARVDESSISELQEKQEVINNWINYTQSGNIYTAKETALQGKFLDDIFSKILGYKDRIKNTGIWNLNQEQLTTIDSKFADGSLGFFTKAKVKIPLEEQLPWQSLFTKQKALAQELKSKIDETDKKIDLMVYELYGLTDEEIKIVEGKE